MLDRMSIARCGPCCGECTAWEDYFNSNTIADYVIVSGAWSIAGSALSCTSAGIIHRGTTILSSSYTANAIFPSPGSGAKLTLLYSYNATTGDYRGVEVTWNTPVTYRVVYFTAATSSTFVAAEGCVWDATSASTINVDFVNQRPDGFGGFTASVHVWATADYVAVSEVDAATVVAFTSKIGVLAPASVGSVDWIKEGYSYASPAKPSCPPGYSCSVGDVTDTFGAYRPWWGYSSYTRSGGAYFITAASPTPAMCKQRPAAGASCSWSVAYSWSGPSDPVFITLRFSSGVGPFGGGITAGITVRPQDYSANNANALLATGHSGYIADTVSSSGSLGVRWEMNGSGVPINLEFLHNGAVKHTLSALGGPMEEKFYLEFLATTGTLPNGVYISNAVYTET